MGTPEQTSPPAAAQARLDAVQRGPVQRVADEWAALQPQLRSSVARLVEALRNGGTELIVFAYRSTETLNRRVGALLLAIDGALAALEPLADDPAIDTLQARIAVQLRSLTTMKQTLVRHLLLANRLEARAVDAIRVAKRRDASFDADWERLQARSADIQKVLDRLTQEMQALRKRSDTGAARTSPPLMAQLQEAAARLVAGTPAAELAELQRGFERIVDAVVIETTSRHFAAQFQHEKAAFAQRLAALVAQAAALRSEAAEIAKLRVQIDAARIARLLGVPVAAVQGQQRGLLGEGHAPMRALTELAERPALERTPKDLHGTLRREGLVA